MDAVKQVIIESIDQALSEFSFINREQFYKILHQDYGFNRENIPDRYEDFHHLLRELYGVKHFEIEREIVRVLHERSESGEYQEESEIPAFAILVSSYMEETTEAMADSKKKLLESEDYLRLINERLSKQEKSNSKKLKL